MKRQIVYALALLAGLMFSLTASASASDWIDLFNGKDLTGWEQKNGTATYEVRNGMIIGTTVQGSPNSFLCTQEHYRDFELEFEVKVDARLNSGVQIRSHSLPDYRNGRVHGYQVEIDPSEQASSGGIYDEARRGWLFDLQDNQDARAAFKRNTWNHFRVRAQGDSIQTWVNGVPVADLRDSMTPSGFIGLQVHSFQGDPPAQARWRNLRIRPLESASQSPERHPAIACPKVLKGVAHVQNNDIRFRTPEGKIVFVDPITASDDERVIACGLTQPDLILITHPHNDHMQLDIIKHYLKQSRQAIVVVPEDTAAQVRAAGIASVRTVVPTRSYEMAGVSFDTVPAYSIEGDLHPKASGWVGYILKINGTRYYVTGDTHVVPEMEQVQADVIFPPVYGCGGSIRSAALMAETVKAKTVVPVHASQREQIMKRLLQAVDEDIAGYYYLQARLAGCRNTECSAEVGARTTIDTLPYLYHVHVNRNFDIDQIAELSREMGIPFGVVDNFGRHYWNYSNGHLQRYLDRVKDKNLYVGIQAEGRDWFNLFPLNLLVQCDFILADGMTFPNTDGTYSRLWVNNEVHISDVHFFMDRYTDYLVDIISEPIDIIANLSYLPEVIRADYDTLWTEGRMDKIINAAVKHNTAIEINSGYRIPSPAFLKRAKAAGVKFAFGANSHNGRDTRNIDYCIEMAGELNLTEKDLFVPRKVKKISGAAKNRFAYITTRPWYNMSQN